MYTQQCRATCSLRTQHHALIRRVQLKATALYTPNFVIFVRSIGRHQQEGKRAGEEEEEEEVWSTESREWGVKSDSVAWVMKQSLVVNRWSLVVEGGTNDRTHNEKENKKTCFAANASDARHPTPDARPTLHLLQ